MILPVDGYGNESMIRQILDQEKPDGIWFMTDPRFYIWLFNMSDEIRDRKIPLFYSHIWDEKPSPKFNKPFYDSCDFIGSISKLTQEVVKDTGTSTESQYIPHASDASIFKPYNKEEIWKKRKEIFGANADKFIIFYNSRNARRKKTSDVLRTAKNLMNKVGQDKVFLFMKCDPHDPEGGNLIEVAQMLDLRTDQINFVPGVVSPEQMATFYNISDVTVCHSSNEGFGLSCQESLYCGTPTIVTQTGGLQEQPIDDLTGEVYGVIVPPSASVLQGSQQIPYINDVHGSDADFFAAYEKMYAMTWDERKAIGLRASESVNRRYAMSDMINKWDAAIKKQIDKYKSSNTVSNRVKIKKV